MLHSADRPRHTRARRRNWRPACSPPHLPPRSSAGYGSPSLRLLILACSSPHVASKNAKFRPSPARFAAAAAVPLPQSPFAGLTFASCPGLSGVELCPKMVYKALSACGGDSTDTRRGNAVSALPSASSPRSLAIELQTLAAILQRSHIRSEARARSRHSRYNRSLDFVLSFDELASSSFRGAQDGTAFSALAHHTLHDQQLCRRSFAHDWRRDV